MENASNINPNGSSSSYDSFDSEDVKELSAHSTAWLATVPLTLSVIIAVTIMGNMMVIAAYFRDQRIRSNVANLFILNLAITDLIVGTFIITVNTSWMIKDSWTTGEIQCKLWLIVDFTVTMMSVITMVLISWDRYCLVKMGMQYKTFQTKKRIYVILVVAWTSVGLWYSFLTFAWSPITGNYNVDYSQDCEMELTFNVAATLVVNIFEFFIPFTVLIFLNTVVFINIKRRSKGTVGQSPSTNSSVSSPKKSYKQNTRSPRRGNFCHSEEPASQGVDSCNPAANAAADPIESHADGEETLNKELSTHSKKECRMFARHRKAAFVLSILIGCFLLCWLPYQVTSIMFAVCNTNCISDSMWEITNSLLWCNSTINPFIYAATNVHFRRNFRQFLLLDRWACDVKRCKGKLQTANRNQVVTDNGMDSTVT
ncbi:muscarinic acetylcholine receptor M5-like [Strongylocentrotus purpuratus]|uniref:G-protein coupled receptors family 1 profile domain-containing protein n=1 Tax=Strongylocentrotus purpuratus TaxID=7668 RepID=A0A7M7RE49_STRPU|nr:muscarinic acetylcholine receptor M5-like [Strongylocentrotus purpuratus]